MWEENKIFFTQGTIIMDSHFSQKQQFTLKNALMIDLFLTNTQLFTPQDINWWTDGLDWSGVACDVFIRCLDSLTAPIHCRGSIGEQVV